MEEKFEYKFYHWEKELGNKPFLNQPFGDRREIYTWQEKGQIARKLARGLKYLELPPKSHLYKIKLVEKT